MDPENKNSSESLIIERWMNYTENKDKNFPLSMYVKNSPLSMYVKNEFDSKFLSIHNKTLFFSFYLEYDL